MKILFIEDELTSYKVKYYHNLLGKLVVHKVTRLTDGKNLTGKTDELKCYIDDVLCQHIRDLKSNRLEANVLNR